jgi:hypothetical protein
MLYDHGQYFIPNINSLGTKIKNLMIILFFKIEYSKLINFLGGICRTCQGTTIYGMFGIQKFEN